MIPKDRLERILSLALPIIGGMVSQNILNLVDAAMVGRLGVAALGAVGLGGFVNFLASAIILGLGAGVQTIAARRIGEDRFGESAVPLTGGVLLSLAIGIPWTVALWFLAPMLFTALADDPEVVKHGVPFLQMRVLGLVALSANMCFRGFWNAINRPGNYMRTLVVMHASNIAFNWVLIYGNLGFPKLGTQGAGLGTTLATVLGTAVYFALDFKEARRGGFLRTMPTKETLASLFRVALPAGVQQLFFAAGMTAFMWIVGKVGTRELAASNVLLNLVLVGVLPGLGFGLASASLVGQALGRKDPTDARAWGWQVSRLALVTVALVAIPGAIAPELILGAFLDDPHTIDLAAPALRLVALLLGPDAAGLVLMQSLIGAGDARRIMMLSIVLQWCLFLPIAYVIGPVWGLGLFAIWAANMVYRLVQAAAFAWMWHGGAWSRVRI